MTKLKAEKKNVNVKRVLLYVSAVLILISAVIYFLPIITHTEPYSLKKTNFSGYDFTRALISDEQTLKNFATQSFFDLPNTKLMAYVIAYLSPICFVYSAIMFVLTLLSTYYKRLNNVFAIGGFFLVWVVLLISVLKCVASLTVIRGELIINNYFVAFGVIVGALSVLFSCVLNVIAIYME